MWAARHGHTAAVEFLIARRADVNHRGSGWCVFDVGFSEMFRLSCTALHLAAYQGHKDVCLALLKAGADKSLTCNDKTARQWALDYGHLALASLINSWANVCDA